jgi:hypothetical protein
MKKIDFSFVYTEFSLYYIHVIFLKTILDKIEDYAWKEQFFDPSYNLFTIVSKWDDFFAAPK